MPAAPRRPHTQPPPGLPSPTSTIPARTSLPAECFLFTLKQQHPAQDAAPLRTLPRAIPPRHPPPRVRLQITPAPGSMARAHFFAAALLLAATVAAAYRPAPEVRRA